MLLVAYAVVLIGSVTTRLGAVGAVDHGDIHGGGANEGPKATIVPALIGLVVQDVNTEDQNGPSLWNRALVALGKTDARVVVDRAVGPRNLTRNRAGILGPTIEQVRGDQGAVTILPAVVQSDTRRTWRRLSRASNRCRAKGSNPRSSFSQAVRVVRAILVVPDDTLTLFLTRPLGALESGAIPAARDEEGHQHDAKACHQQLVAMHDHSCTCFLQRVGLLFLLG